MVKLSYGDGSIILKLSILLTKMCCSILKLFSDTCLIGWGPTYNGHLTGRHWSFEESKSHVNVLEMKGAYLHEKYIAKMCIKF